MQLDIRVPIGALFTLLGIILLGSGMLAEPASYGRALGHNVNLSWGAVIFVVGLLFLWLARRSIGRVASPRD